MRNGKIRVDEWNWGENGGKNPRISREGDSSHVPLSIFYFFNFPNYTRGNNLLKNN
jgi:hypothetical protein